MKNIKVILSENFHFFEVKFSIYFNRRNFVMLDVDLVSLTNRPHKPVYIIIVVLINERRMPSVLVMWFVVRERSKVSSFANVHAGLSLICLGKFFLFA